MKIRNVKGFTLLEIMMVIAIIGVLILAASPNFSSSKDHFKLHTTMRNCVLDIRYAQQLSMDTKKQHGVYFTQNGYTVQNTADAQVIKTVNFSGGVVYTADSIDSNAVVFGTDGTPFKADKAAQLIGINKADLTVSGSNLHGYINITPRTGEVSSSWN